MAKISDLESAIPTANDSLLFVDTGDTTQSASGTTKRSAFSSLATTLSSDFYSGPDPTVFFFDAGGDSTAERPADIPSSACILWTNTGGAEPDNLGTNDIWGSLVNAESLSAVATSGSYDDLDDKPVLGTAASNDQDDFASAAQGELADTSLQPRDDNIEIIVSRSVSTDASVVASDRGRAIDVTSEATITIPSDATLSLAVGSVITVSQFGSGEVTLEAGSGVTLNGVSAGSGVISSQWQGVVIRKVAANEWVAQGDIGVVEIRAPEISDLQIFGESVEFTSTTAGTAYWVISEETLEDADEIIAEQATADDGGSFSVSENASTTIDFDDALFGERTFQIAVVNSAGSSNVLTVNIDFGAESQPLLNPDPGFDDPSAYELVANNNAITGSQAVLAPANSGAVIRSNFISVPGFAGRTVRLEIEFTVTVEASARLRLLARTAADGFTGVFDETITSSGLYVIEEVMPADTAGLKMQIEPLDAAFRATADEWSLQEVV